MNKNLDKQQEIKTGTGFEEEEGINIWEYIDVVWRRKKLLLIISPIIIIAVFLGKTTKPPVYEASGTLVIESGSEGIGFANPFAVDTSVDDYLNTQVKLLKSRRMAQMVIEELKIVESRPNTQKPEIDTGSRMNLLREQEGRIRDAVMSDTIDFFLSVLEVRAIENSRIVEVKFKSGNPELAANSVNTLFKKYIDFNLQIMSESTKQLSEFFTKQIEDLRKNLSLKEKELQEYGKKNEIFYLNGKETTVVEKFAELNRALTEAQVFRIQKESAFKEIQAIPLENLPDVRRDSLIQSLKREYALAESQYQQKSHIYKDSYPEMQRLKSQMLSIQQRINTETQEIGQKVIKDAESEYQSALKKENSLADLLGQQKKNVVSTNSSSIYYSSLSIEVENMRNLLSQLVKKESESIITSRMEKFQTSNIKIIDWAEIPSAPLSSKKMMGVIMSVGVGGGVGLGIIFLIEFIFLSIHKLEFASKFLKTHALGIIPAFHTNLPTQSSKENLNNENGPPGDENTEIDSNEHEDEISRKNSKARDHESFKSSELTDYLDLEKQFPENFRNIRSELLFTIPNRTFQTIAIASACPQDGKTATAVNIAVSFTKIDKKILLIDANLKTPVIHHVFNINQTPGLSTYLEKKCSIEQIIIPSHIPNLSIIPAGHTAHNSCDLLNLKLMENLLEYSKEHYDYIFIDTPAMVDLIDSYIIGSIADSVILVIWGGATPKRKIKKVRDEIKKFSDIHLIGVIMNKIGVKMDWKKNFDIDNEDFFKKIQALPRKLWL